MSRANHPSRGMARQSEESGVVGTTSTAHVVIQCSHSFVHTPQHHWHAAIVEGILVVTQKVRERIVLIDGMLDRFGCRTEQKGGESRAHAERAIEGPQVVCLVEPLDERITRLELQMGESRQDVTKNQTRINIERAYVDKNFTEIEQTLMGLTHSMSNVEEITKIGTVCKANHRI